MTEKINFKSFKKASDVRELLESRIPIGVATPIDVFSFLGEQGLKHSELVDINKYPGVIAKEPFERTIFGSARAKRMGWLLFEAYWDIKFHFNNQKLAKIEVIETARGF